MHVIMVHAIIPCPSAPSLLFGTTIPTCAKEGWTVAKGAI